MTRPFLIIAAGTLLTLSSLLGAPLVAIAQPAKAAEAFEEGQKCYAVGDYGCAIFQFNAAYDEDPNGIFLYMTSLSYLKAGNAELALRYGQRAQEQSGDLDPDQRARNGARVQALSLSLDSVTRAQQVAASIPTRDLTLTEPVEPIEADESRGIGAAGWTGLGLVVAGGGLLGASYYFSTKLTELDEKDGVLDNRILEEDEDERRQYQTAGIVALSSGAVLTLLGGGMFIYGLGNRSSASLQLAPTRGGAAAAVSFSF